jgi:hypothetical protein
VKSPKVEKYDWLIDAVYGLGDDFDSYANNWRNLFFYLRIASLNGRCEFRDEVEVVRAKSSSGEAAKPASR